MDACCCGCSHPQGAVLEVKAHNERAIRLYTRHGFVEVGRRPKFYACGSDAVLMARPPAAANQTTELDQGGARARLAPVTAEKQPTAWASLHAHVSTLSKMLCSVVQGVSDHLVECMKVRRRCHLSTLASTPQAPMDDLPEKAVTDLYVSETLDLHGRCRLHFATVKNCNCIHPAFATACAIRLRGHVRSV